MFSTDGSHLEFCKNCSESPCVCEQQIEIYPNDISLKMRIEKKGRGGKAVTVILDLPYNPDYFKKLSKKLKSHCGTGGSYKDRTIEIQGDQRDKVQIFLEKIGFKVIRSGG